MPPATNVLHLIETSGPGGAENMMLRLAEALDPRRYRSIFCLLKDGWLRTQLASRGFDVAVVPNTHTPDFRWIWKVTRLVRTQRVDIMHAHEFAMNTYGSLVSLLTDVPAIATVHGKNYYADKLHRRLAYRFVARQSTMVAVSEDVREFLVQQVGVPPDRVTTVHNGIDMERYAPDPKVRYEERTRLGISNDELLVGAVGNLYAVKGHRYLLEALAQVRQSAPNIRCVIAGRGELRADLERHAAVLGIASNVQFLGFYDRVPALLQAIDVFVHPSVSEGLPLAVLEAMASGKPVIATRVGGIPEVVVHGRNGLLAAPASAEDLARQLEAILVSPSIGRRLGEEARETVREWFGMAAMVARYGALYGRALNGRRRS